MLFSLILFVILRFAWPLVLLLVIRWAIRRARNSRVAPDWKTTEQPQKESQKTPDFKGPVYTVRYEDVKLHIRQFRERAGMRAYFMFAFRSELPIVEHLKEAREAWEERKKTNS